MACRERGGNYQEELERRFMKRTRMRNLNPGKSIMSIPDLDEDR